MDISWGWNILWGILGISLLVTIHEYGHFWVARKLGFKVLRFSVGFGKPLWKRVGAAPDHTEYVIAAVPLGGYVRMLDERDGAVPTADLPRAFTRKPPWQRILVLLAGPAANILFAIVVLSAMIWVKGVLLIKPVVGNVTIGSLAADAGLRSQDTILAVNGREVDDQLQTSLSLLDAISDDGPIALRVRTASGGERDVSIAVEDEARRFELTKPDKLMPGLGFEFWVPVVPPKIFSLQAGGPADRAGLAVGDLIVAADGQPVRSWNELSSYTRARPDKEIVFTVRREGAEFSRRITPMRVEEDGKTFGLLKVGGPQEEDFEKLIPETHKIRANPGPLSSLAAGTSRAWEMTAAQAKFFWRMLTKRVSTDNLTSVISIAKYAGQAASAGPGSLLMLLVLLSLSLGFLNLLPIPILDGGQIVFQVAEWIRGRPLSDRVYLLGQQAGLLMIVLLMGVALFNDITIHVASGAR